MYFGLGLPHVREPPLHFMSTYDILRVECAEQYNWALATGNSWDDIFAKGAGRQA